MPLLEQATRLYQGDLLEEDPYEEWVQTPRAALRRSFLEILQTLVTGYRQQARYESAVLILQRLLTLEPLDEAAHRDLMLSLAQNGRRQEALRQFQLCRDALDIELGLEPSPETNELYQRILSGDIAAVPAPPAPKAEVSVPPEAPVVSNVPQSLTPLVGRTHEVAQVVALLIESPVRLLTLTGPGGTGKTRLSLQVANQLQTSFEHGVHFVGLAAISDPELVPTAIAQALGVKEAVGDLPPLESLKLHLQNRRLLLVLDNFEQIVAASEQVVALLSAAPGLKVLVTSRAVLRVYGEQEYAVLTFRSPTP